MTAFQFLAFVVILGGTLWEAWRWW